MIKLANSRLTWVRDQVYQYWNPDYNKSAPNEKTTAEASKGSRPTRYLLVMDARWWAWNIAFALMPAILIGLYCELIGQPAMVKFHQQQEMHQLKQVLGGDADVEGLLEPPPPNLWQRVKRLGEDIRSGVQLIADGGFSLYQSSEDDSDTEEPLPSREDSKTDPSAVPQPATRRLKEGILTNPRGLDDSKTAATGVSPSVRTAQSDYDPATIKSTVAEMKSRLEQLEQAIQDQEKKPPPPTKASIERQLERLQQSGVSKRVEEQLVATIKDRVKSAKDTENSHPPVHPSPVSSATNQTSWWSNLWGSHEMSSDPAISSSRIPNEGVPPPTTSAPSGDLSENESDSEVQASEAIASDSPPRKAAPEIIGHGDKDKSDRRPWWKVL